MMSEQIRNKYNTLTPAEAKKLNRHLRNGMPIRTASVLHKPRAPPIVVTNLDNTIERELQDAGGDNLFTPQRDTLDGSPRSIAEDFTRSASTRSSSVCPTASNTCDRRHSVNYGRTGALASRLSLFSSASNNSKGKNIQNARQTQLQRQLQISPHESLSNLSFKSSRDAPPPEPACVYNEPAYRFQTMSVDLGGSRPASIAYDTMRAKVRYGAQRSSTINTKFSDESFSSAKSEMSNMSGRSSSVTPTKFNHFAINVKEPPRSASKASLSNSTYKVFQSPLANFKKLFRGMQRPFAQLSNNQTDSQRNVKKATTKQQQCDTSSLTDLSLSDSFSQISLNKSQSPPVFPPPPGELKSMSYLESEVSNYSNYDEFTKSRNERLPQGNPLPALFTTDPAAMQQEESKLCSNTFTNQQQRATNEQHQTYCDKIDNIDDVNWQMTSLPVYFERNLTTVFEEKQPSCELTGDRKLQTTNQAGQGRSKRDTDEIYQMIKPPRRFDNINKQHQQRNLNAEERTNIDRAPSTDSANSQALSANTDPFIEYQRQQPATPYRFSFAQPLPDSNQASHITNLGLPPRMPTSQQQQQQQQQTPPAGPTIISESLRQDNSSSGNSSNCSSQLNGIDFCDRQDNLLEQAGATGATATHANDKLSCSTEDSCGYGDTDNNGMDNEQDVTILSETSTIQGDSGSAFYANKCTELERTIATLMNKLIVKEKELTELQLTQLNNDYTIERLKKQVNKLERENAQLKTIVARNNKTANAISRLQV